MRGIGANGEENRISPRSLPHVGIDAIPASEPGGLVTMKAIGERVRRG